MTSLLLLPGLACDRELFAGVLQAWPGLAPKVHVGDAHERHATLPAMAAALLVEQPGDQVLVGVSMGGMLALEMQRQAPQRIRGLALLGTSARADTPEQLALRTQACELFAAGRADEVLRANVVFAFHPAHSDNPRRVAEYLAMVGRAGAAQLVAQNRAVMARPDSRPGLAQIGCPVLVACGEADGLTPPAHSRELAAAIAGAELHLLAGAGHMLTIEQPAAVAALLAGWLARSALG